MAAPPPHPAPLAHTHTPHLPRAQVVEHARPGPLGSLLDPQHRGTLQLGQLTEALRAAGDDGRVKGLLALLSAAEGGLGFAQTQELRDAVAEFRCAGRKRGSWEEGLTCTQGIRA